MALGRNPLISKEKHRPTPTNSIRDGKPKKPYTSAAYRYFANGAPWDVARRKKRVAIDFC
jgi:hypothetical protein